LLGTKNRTITASYTQRQSTFVWYGYCKVVSMSNEMNFLKQINDSVAEAFTEIIYGKNGSFQFFKKSSKVFADQPSSGSSEFFVWIYDINSSDERVTTFNSEDADGNIVVYRQPAVTTFSLCLSCPKISLQEKLVVLEKINAYFFDNKLIKPFIPEELKKIAPAIYQKLESSDAQITLSKEKSDPLEEGVTIKFEYKALYHTGSPIRVDKKVQTRKLDVSQR